MIPHLEERAAALAPLGWTGRDAEWLAFVCLHSGVFLRSQYLTFTGETHPNEAARFVRRCGCVRAPPPQDPLHRGPGDRVPEVRERVADPCVAPLRILDRHPDHERGDFAARHRPASTAAGAAVVFLGDQSSVPAKDRVRGDDARDLPEDLPAEFVAAHSESPTLSVGQAKRPRAQVFPEDPILLPEIFDQIVLVAVHPASEREDKELQRRRHGLRLLGETRTALT